MLLEQLKNKKNKARLNKNQKDLKFISFILGEILVIGKNDGNRVSTHEEALSYIKGYMKKRRDYLELMKKINNIEEETNAKYEIDYLQELIEAYIPKELNEDEHKILLKNVISEGASNIGEVMKSLKGIEGINMKLASKIARELL